MYLAYSLTLYLLLF